MVDACAGGGWRAEEDDDARGAGEDPEGGQCCGSGDVAGAGGGMVRMTKPDANDACAPNGEAADASRGVSAEGVPRTGVKGTTVAETTCSPRRIVCGSWLAGRRLTGMMVRSDDTGDGAEVHLGAAPSARPGVVAGDSVLGEGLSDELAGMPG